MISPDENKKMSVENSTAKLRVVKSAPLIINEPQVWMDFGEFSLLIPSREIVALLSAKNIEVNADAVAECGSILYETQKFLVFSINKNLQLDTEFPPNQSVVLLLQHQEICFGISGKELIKVNESALNIHKVPLCMSSRKQPFTDFVILNERAAGISSSEAILSLLRLRGVKSFSLKEQAVPYLKGVK